jgi:hypothetical protein
MKISFIIISNGKKPDKVENQIKSIESLNIPEYEIIISGIYSSGISNDNIHYINDQYNANRGSLGGLRNTACSIASYENIVVSDDDMLFTSDWYCNLLKSPDFDILTTRILNPDGTRFWDNACYMSPNRGHIIMNPEQQDDFLYMSGGQSWIMKKYVWDKVKWDSEILFYNVKGIEDYKKGLHNEDTYFSFLCRENGFKIIYDHNTIVIHDDPSYTSIGRIVRRRIQYQDWTWVEKFNFPEKIAVDFAVNLFQNGFEAEAADILRKYSSVDNYFLAKQAFMQIENMYGGPLKDSNFIYDR